MTNDDIITKVLADEGSEYTDLALDRGGPTRYGITIPALTDWWRSQGHAGSPMPDDIRAIDEAAARGYYGWLLEHSGIGRIVNDTLRYFVFDAAVNSGVSQAVRLLQRALSLREDGILGPVTLAATPYLDANKLCRLFAIEQMLFYARLGQPAFLLGWIERLSRKMRMVA